MQFLMTLAVLIGLLASSSAMAKSTGTIGSVTEFSGSATISRGKENIAVGVGTPIEQNDRVQTRNGKVKIVFADKTTVSVVEHSSLVIDDFVYDAGSGAGKIGLKATQGTVRYVSGMLAKDPKQVKINTPTATIAVRGTDFVMSVDEIGRSMVILMPTCDWETSAIKGLVCGSGAIDVQSGTNIVSLNRPYQATLVETSGQPPTPPVTVNLFNSPISNNLQIAPPRTAGGANVVAVARAAATSTGVIRNQSRNTTSSSSSSSSSSSQDTKSDSSSSSDTKDQSKEVAGATSEETQKVSSTTSEATNTIGNAGSKDSEPLKPEVTGAVNVVTIPSVTIPSVTEPKSTETTTNTPSVTITEDGKTESRYVKKLYSDRGQTVQVGWAWESLSNNSRNYAQVTQSLNTQIQITVTQDMQTNTWSFVQRTSGQIVINQTYR